MTEKCTNHDAQCALDLLAAVGITEYQIFVVLWLCGVMALCWWIHVGGYLESKNLSLSAVVNHPLEVGSWGRW